MATLTLTQNGTVGTKDQNFVYNQSPSSWHPDPYSTNKPLRIGTEVHLSNRAHSAVFLRWKLDLADTYLRIDDTYLILKVASQENTNLLLNLKVGLYFDSGPIAVPITAADAAILMANVTNWASMPLYEANDYFYSVNLKEQLQEIVDHGSWTSGETFWMFIKTDDGIGGSDRTITFNSYSYDTLSGVGTDDSPEIFINYSFSTPNPGTGYHIEHQLTPVQSIQYNLYTNLEVEHELELVQTISHGMIFSRDVENELEVIQSFSFTRNTAPLSVTSQLHLTQTVSAVKCLERSIESTLNVSHWHEISGTPLYAHVEHLLNIIQDIIFERHRYFEIENDITIVQDILSSQRTIEVIHQLALKQTISTNGSSLADPYDINHSLSIVQDIPTPTAERSRSIEHELTIEQEGSYYINFTPTRPYSGTGSFSQDFYRSGGSGAAASGYTSGGGIGQSPTAFGLGSFGGGAGCVRPDLLYQDASKIPLSEQGNFVIYFPDTGTPTHTVVLRSPIFGNVENMEISRVFRRTRGGDLKTFEDSQWPEVDKRQFKFEGLSEATKDAFVALVVASLGLKVRVRTHENETLIGVLANPDAEQTQELTNCNFNVAFDLEI